MRRAVIVVLAAPLLAIAQGGATANHRPPTGRLIAGDHGQEGRLHSACWAQEDGPTLCTVSSAWVFPSVRRAPGDSQARVRFRFPERIAVGRVTAWRRTYESSVHGEQPAGDGHVLRSGVRKMFRDGALVGWVVVFHLPDREGERWFAVGVDWEDRGSATYAFHLDLR